MVSASGSRRPTAWAVFALLAIAMYGDFYVYDSIGPVADLLQRQRGFTSTQIGMLNAIYNLPNVVLILIGGVLVDRYGAARVTLCTAALCLAGAVLTAFSSSFGGMATGRLLFGIGAETFGICRLVAIAEYFATGRVALAMGLLTGIARVGSFSADISPMWFADAYRHGWQPPLMIATHVAALSFTAAFGYWWLDRRIRRDTPVRASNTDSRFDWGGVLRFGSAYWYLVALCVLWYAAIFAFRSTFSIEYFQHAHGLDLAGAGAMNSYVFLAAIFMTPAFGWVCDRIGRYAPMLAFGALLLPLSIVVMALTHWSLWVATVMIGVSFSLVPAVLWPLSSKLVSPARFGTALGVMQALQNAGIAGANLVAGRLNDLSAASAQNPAGYRPMMLFFGAVSTLAFGFALLLWFASGGRHREAVNEPPLLDAREV
jgi:MFS family permease